MASPSSLPDPIREDAQSYYFINPTTQQEVKTAKMAFTPEQQQDLSARFKSSLPPLPPGAPPIDPTSLEYGGAPVPDMSSEIIDPNARLVSTDAVGVPSVVAGAGLPGFNQAPTTADPSAVNFTVPPGMMAPGPVEITEKPPAPEVPGVAPAVGVGGVGGDQYGLGEAYEKQKTAVEKAAASQSQYLADAANAQEQFQDNLKNEYARDEAATKVYQDELAGQRKKLDTAIEDTQIPIDRGRWWKQAKGYQKVGAAIAAALGAIGQALTRQGPNQAMGVILSSIEQDIDEQKANIEGKKTKAGLEIGVYDRMRRQFGDESQARAASRTALIDQTKARVQSMSLESQSEQTKANAENLMAQLDEESAKSRMAFDQYASKLAASKASSNVALYVNGIGLAFDKQSAKIARDAKSKYEEVANTLSDLRTWRSKAGPTTYAGANWKNKTLGEGISTRAQLALKELAGMGANFSPKEVELIESLVPDDPSDWGFIDERLKQAEKMAEEKFESIMRSQIRDYRGTPETQLGFKEKR